MKNSEQVQSPETLTHLCLRDRVWLEFSVQGEREKRMTHAEPLKAMGGNLALILVAMGSPWTILIYRVILVFTLEKFSVVLTSVETRRSPCMSQER